jgi:hypothetical protein
MVWQAAEADRNLLGLNESDQMLRLNLNAKKKTPPDFEVAFAGANLIREQLDLTVTTSRAVSAEFQIFDSAGRWLNTRHYDLSEGSQRLLLRDISLPPGAYWLAVQSPLGQRTVRFIGL